jgi:hypothetical protein
MRSCRTIRISLRTLCIKSIMLSPIYVDKKLALTSPTGGGRSVGIVRSWTKAMEFSLVILKGLQLQLIGSLLRHLKTMPQLRSL